ncbi:hypothetical protein GCM10011492_22790 [Flexivirga endophytica]|uniref:Peptidase M10 metallopeptidase domain-containing protein n=2 Tax=Flexivirga endophytica TaxID=1849103 RepID=A0A916WUQ8_9MICO|nr:hypothetical protein GCM10011492_22790 [Flexivirga endophytica]
MREPVKIVRVRNVMRCSCGEAIRPGERAGLVGGRGRPRCVQCLADLQAGRKSPISRSTRTRGARPWTAMIVAFVLVGAVGAVNVRSSILGGAEATSLSKGSDRDIRAHWPPVPPDASANPLGAPPAQASSSTEFSFIKTVGDGADTHPVAWDPCRPIHLVINDARAPEQGDPLLQEAIAQVTEATGLQFVVDGPTTEAPATDRPPRDTARYGDRWSPVLVAWTDPSAVPHLKGSVAGVAGPDGAPFYTAEQRHWVSGSVNLDGPQLSLILQRPAGWETARAIVMHEFGHLVGLQHVPQPSQLMYASSTNRTDFGRGDREGLRQLGDGHCFTG